MVECHAHKAEGKRSIMGKEKPVRGHLGFVALSWNIQIPLNTELHSHMTPSPLENCVAFIRQK